ncbi:MAG: SDR family NAD(P)-dependent oxidoreductase, partial [Candidatus Handelsmanbacteria bacterium]|nr:SDR family NAD(P)-dependent oxidoreductase [Candidatus Handelsmanbacteria bacterium]
SELAGYLEGKGGPGGLIGISSVAGDRGRQSNYAYGAAKGGLSLFLQGLRNRLASTPVHVLTVKPGFVDTPMTRGLEGLFLVASPEKVASDVLRAYKKRKDILYTPWFWRYIMFIIKNIPEGIFKRLKL